MDYIQMSFLQEHNKDTFNERQMTIQDNTAYHSDYLDFMRQLPDGCVELILTDPPYARKYLSLYTGLAAEAKRVLRVGGSLLTMAPNFMLPEVMAHMGMFLKWRWMICHDYWNSSHARMIMGVEVAWKPILWYVNEKLSPNKWICDMIPGEGRKKDLHPWQQNLDWAIYLIKQLTDEGDMVLDPFVGSGTVAEAAERLERKWLACDKDLKAVIITDKRIQEYRDGLIVKKLINSLESRGDTNG